MTLKEGDERRNTLRETQAKTKGKVDRYNVSIWFKAYYQISSMMQILENRRGMENRRQNLYSIFRLLSFARWERHGKTTYSGQIIVNKDISTEVMLLCP